MIKLFRIEEGHVRPVELERLTEDALAAAGWIDVENADAEEKQLLQCLLHTDLPKSHHIEEIEPSSRCYVDKAGIHLHSLFLSEGRKRKATCSVVCILQSERLVTIRDTELPDFTSLHAEAASGKLESVSPMDLLLTVFEKKVDNLADYLEGIHHKLEEASQLVLDEASNGLKHAISQLAGSEDTNGKIHLSLMDTKRDTSFLHKHLRDKPELQTLEEFCEEIMHDIDTLSSHNMFLFNKINFLMESTQGFISIQQNQVIKTLSVAAVVFLPPTLVSSIYGMNFTRMPELDWAFGYPFALGLILLSGIASYWLFKRID